MGSLSTWTVSSTFTTSKMAEVRINIRLNMDLVEWAKVYARRKGFSLSGLIRKLLVEERERDERVQEADQI